MSCPLKPTMANQHLCREEDPSSIFLSHSSNTCCPQWIMGLNGLYAYIWKLSLIKLAWFSVCCLSNRLYFYLSACFSLTCKFSFREEMKHLMSYSQAGFRHFEVILKSQNVNNWKNRTQWKDVSLVPSTIIHSVNQSEIDVMTCWLIREFVFDCVAAVISNIVLWRVGENYAFWGPNVHR